MEMSMSCLATQDDCWLKITQSSGTRSARMEQRHIHCTEAVQVARIQRRNDTTWLSQKDEAPLGCRNWCWQFNEQKDFSRSFEISGFPNNCKGGVHSQTGSREAVRLHGCKHCNWGDAEHPPKTILSHDVWCCCYWQYLEAVTLSWLPLMQVKRWFAPSARVRSPEAACQRRWKRFAWIPRHSR